MPSLVPLLSLFLLLLGDCNAGWGGPDPPAYHYDGPTNSTVCKNSITSGWMTVTMDGVKKNVTLMTKYPPLILPEGETITVKHNGNAFFGNGCYDEFNPDQFEKWYLVGKSLSWVSSIDGASCGCNASPFLAGMPQLDITGKPIPQATGNYECAAPQGCFEFDTYEANTHAFQTTSHVCRVADPNGHTANCSGPGDGKYGCSVNTNRLNDTTKYGPGPSYYIDTSTSFWTGIFFLPDSTGKVLKQVNVVIAQGKKSIVMELNASVCSQYPSDYMQRMGEQLDRGVSVIVCYWGDTGSRMQWLDIPPCTASQNCDENSEVTYSAFEVNTLKPEDYNKWTTSGFVFPEHMKPDDV